MTRRESIRRATLLGIGMVLGRFSTVQTAPDTLMVNLNQWATVTFQLDGKEIAVSVSEIFAALEKG